uniref:Enhancer of polycomb homolog 1 n=1 Tax=Oncorhynchus mykiss TaxID=8022 RepID=A0A8K9UCK1_ONCMY
MSKLSFRARALDASKPLPVFRCEDLPDLHEYASINRAVPQMPTGMEKEEESLVIFAGGDFLSTKESRDSHESDILLCVSGMCLVCWRNGKGPVQGGANDQTFFMCLCEDDTGGKMSTLHASSRKGPCF